MRAMRPGPAGPVCRRPDLWPLSGLPCGALLQSCVPARLMVRHCGSLTHAFAKLPLKTVNDRIFTISAITPKTAGRATSRPAKRPARSARRPRKTPPPFPQIKTRAPPPNARHRHPQPLTQTPRRTSARIALRRRGCWCAWAATRRATAAWRASRAPGGCG